MCTADEAQKALRLALTDRDKDGVTVIERELIQEGDKIVRKLTFRFGLAVITLAITSTVAWYNIVYRVGNLEDRMSEGGRFTQEEADKHIVEQQKTDQAQDLRIAEFREDVSKQLDDMDGKLDTMQTLLYQIAREK